MSRKLQQIMVILGALSVSSAAADGFSATVGIPVTPVFGVGAALNYTYEISPNWFVGGSLRASYVPIATTPFSVSARIGTNYIINLTDTTDLKADAYVGGGINAYFGSSGLITTDVETGAKATFSVSPMAKVYGSIDAGLSVPLASTTATTYVFGSISTYVGGKLEPVKDLEVYAQAGLGYSGFFGRSGGVGYDLGLGAYYSLTPELRLGASVGFNGDFRAGISLQYVQKPGTLATPGNFLP
jgi:hypothetical protein